MNQGMIASKKEDQNTLEEIERILLGLSIYDDAEIENSVNGNFSNDEIMSDLSANDLYVLLNNLKAEASDMYETTGEGYVLEEEV